MKTITYFSVHDAFDAEGRGPDQEIGAFFDKGVADDYAKGNGNYGNDARVTQKVIVICDTVEELAESKIEQKRRKALRKLTDEDKELLGLI